MMYIIIGMHIRIYGSDNCVLPSFKEYYSYTCCDAHFARICVVAVLLYYTECKYKMFIL
jgi:hypothetical protein